MRPPTLPSVLPICGLLPFWRRGGGNGHSRRSLGSWLLHGHGCASRETTGCVDYSKRWGSTGTWSVACIRSRQLFQFAAASS